MNGFQADYFRMTGKKWSAAGCLDLLFRYDLRYLWVMRMKKTKLKSILALRM